MTEEHEDILMCSKATTDRTEVPVRAPEAEPWSHARQINEEVYKAGGV